MNSYEIATLVLLCFVWPIAIWVSIWLFVGQKEDKEQEQADLRVIEQQNDLCGWLSLKAHTS